VSQKLLTRFHQQFINFRVPGKDFLTMLTSLKDERLAMLVLGACHDSTSKELIPRTTSGTSVISPTKPFD